ncbi:MAG: hypothetical protein ACHQC8_07680 [Solirubrobacterales bacterium]
MRFLKTDTALSTLGAVDAMNVASPVFASIDMHVNATVCDNEYDVDGDFDVVGVYDEDGNLVGAMPRGRGQGGYGRQAGRGSQQHAGGRGGSRGMQRGSQSGRGGFQPPRPNLPPGVQAPPWWKGTAGVNQPNEMLHVMPLVPDTNNGVFAAAFTAATITFISRPQKPFRGERIITNVTASAAATAVPQSTGIFVGVDLQQVEAGNIPLSTWAATAFGVRLAMVDAEPGIEIRIPVVLVGAALGTSDTISVSVTILGRVLA